jgi:hypothetical protein
MRGDEHHLVHPLERVAVRRVPVELLLLHHPDDGVAVAGDVDDLAHRGAAPEHLLPARRAEDDDLRRALEVLAGDEAALGGVEVVHRPVARGGARDVEPLLVAGCLHDLVPDHRGLDELERRRRASQRERVFVREALRPLLLRILLHLAGVELADEHLADAARLVPELLALPAAAVDQTEGRDHRGDAEDDADHLQQAAAAVGVDVDDAVLQRVPEGHQVASERAGAGHCGRASLSLRAASHELRAATLSGFTPASGAGG